VPVGCTVAAVEIQTNKLAVVVDDIPVVDLVGAELNAVLALHPRFTSDGSKACGGA